ncbi:MAG: hypothetical protein K2J92_08540 [Muribaculaceae bacterium]|nr:hypothetical protein [Muribaculaceae bacterium]
MITDVVIKDIYKKFNKPAHNVEDLNVDYFVALLKDHHTLRVLDDEIIVDDLDEFNPFRRFLMRGINAILEFDKMVAFVFRNHILFFGKENNELRVHIKPEKPRSFFGRLFGRE